MLCSFNLTSHVTYQLPSDMECNSITRLLPSTHHTRLLVFISPGINVRLRSSFVTVVQPVRRFHCGKGRDRDRGQVDDPERSLSE